jgi:lipoprotein-releasing system permease protein
VLEKLGKNDQTLGFLLGLWRASESWPVAVRVGVLVLLSVVGWALILYGLYRLGGRSGRGLVRGLTVLFFLSTLGLGAWAFSLPESVGARFDLVDQVVRAAAALSAMLLSVFSLVLVVPKVLQKLEQGDFIAFVAVRHVRSKKSGFLTVISGLSILGVCLSSFVLCCVVSIMGGFGADLKEKILNNNAQIRVELPHAGGFDFWRQVLDEVRATPGVFAATPIAQGEVMASSSTDTAGMVLRGIETESLPAVIDIPSHMEVGSFDLLDDPLKLRLLPADTPIGIGTSGEVYLKGRSDLPTELGDTDSSPTDVYPGIVLGRELARSLHAYVGDVLTVVSPMGDLGPMGIMPRTRKFRVAGIFYTGMYEYDVSQAYVKQAVAQEILDLGQLATSIDIRAKRIEDVGHVTTAVREAIERPELSVRNWEEMNRSLFSALKLEKIATFLVLSIAILVASFCIICTLLLMVTEKSKEIAILKAMGTSDRGILRLFMSEGMLIGGIGTVAGVTIGYTLMQSLKYFGVRLDPEVYYIERLPVSVEEFDYFLIALCAFGITTLATLYPARAASRLRPVDGIRYE